MHKALKSLVIVAVILASFLFAGIAYSQPATSKVTGIVYDGAGNAIPNTTIIFNIPQQIVAGNIIRAQISSAKTNAKGEISAVLPQRAAVTITVGSGMAIQGLVPGAGTSTLNQIVGRITFPDPIVIVQPNEGGTGINTGNSTGIPSIAAGTWSVISQISPTIGGTGANTSGSTGTARVDAGTWSAGNVKIESYTQAGLPAPGTAGRLARVSNDDVHNVRGVYTDQGSQWYNLQGGVINARSFAGVTGDCTDDQTAGLTSFLAALNAVPAQNVRQNGYLPRGCYRYTAALPDISGNGVTIVGDGLQSVLFNDTANVTAHALTVTGQNVTLAGITIEGDAASGHGIWLNESHYITMRDVTVISTGTGQNGLQVEGVITGLFINVRGTCNVPGCTQFTTDITDNGTRGIPNRAVNMLDGATFSNNNHSWINFRNNGGHSGHGVVIGGTATGITFSDPVFEAPPIGFYALLVATNTKNNVLTNAYISCSAGLGLNLDGTTANTIVGGQSNCATLVNGDSKSNSFVNFETTGNVNISVTGGSTPRMNSFLGGRITGTITDNGLNTVFVGVTDNTNLPITNKMADLTLSSPHAIQKWTASNGASIQRTSETELHTLALAATSSTAITFPANSNGAAASFRITTEVTGCTSIDVGVGGATTRYGNFSTLTAGQTLARAISNNYPSATPILFTCNGGGGTFTAGVIRAIIHFETANAPTS